MNGHGSFPRHRRLVARNPQLSVSSIIQRPPSATSPSPSEQSPTVTKESPTVSPTVKEESPTNTRTVEVSTPQTAEQTIQTSQPQPTMTVEEPVDTIPPTIVVDTEEPPTTQEVPDTSVTPPASLDDVPETIEVAEDPAQLTSTSSGKATSIRKDKTSTTRIHGTQTGAPGLDDPASHSTMTAGGKAGIAIGIILIVGALLALAYYCLRKRKSRRRLRSAASDNEKNLLKAAAPIKPSTNAKNGKTAPRLSLRPVTQFLPYGGEKRSSAIQLAETNSQEHNKNNPFGNHAESVDSASTPVVRVTDTENETKKDASVSDDNGSKSLSTPASGPTANVASPGVANLIRTASKRGDKPLDLTTTGGGPNANPPSPSGTDFTETTENGQPSSTSGAAIAAAGGPPNTTVHRVQLDFKPSMEDELELQAGQLVRLLHEYDDGWAMCIRLDRSQQGVAPRTCLSARPVKPRPQNPRGPPPAMRQTPPRNQGPPYPVGPMENRPHIATDINNGMPENTQSNLADSDRSKSATHGDEAGPVYPDDQVHTGTPQLESQPSSIQASPIRLNFEGSFPSLDDKQNISTQGNGGAPNEASSLQSSTASSRRPFPGQAF